MGTKLPVEPPSGLNLTKHTPELTNAFQDVAATTTRELLDVLPKVIDDGVEIWSLRYDFRRAVEIRDDPRHVVFAKIVNRRPLKDSLAKNCILIDLHTVKKREFIRY